MATPDVAAKVTYLLPPPDGERAYQRINADPKTGEREKNIVREEHDVKIENIRGKEHLFTLDNAGFQFYNRPTKFNNFRDNKRVEAEYYPESEELIKELTGASRVVFFDHTHRLRRPGEVDSSPDRRQPVAQAHVDQTTASSIARVHRHLPPTDAPALLRRRFQIINLWRPIANPAIDWPLALCDYRSVNPKNDTFPVALVYPDREGETMGVRHNSKHEWKYLYGMTPDEIVLIKCFDSLQDGSVALFTPHTGFQDSTTPKGTPPRESIELRALVFYD
ncbi:hypothetical protein P691DRAFT_732024 [Macrolepiota fuliginosa MF-IS2]|uniref:7alpha-cephem-methoxylase P8 chain n=1 Tax=Macrolepiota fuliginosa MF-IS2 TaxID=1400762 RepID=A0A9P5X9V2_9AGAR|nr:hypothetical protein P691DRAFT_732024 [Macrolepiota fuliginosa MF-IS2]